MYRYFFPKLGGGGWMRRYWQYRTQIETLQAFSPDGRPLPPFVLLDFKRPVDRDDAAQPFSSFMDESSDTWKITDDRTLGGYTTSTAALVQTRECWQKHIVVDTKENLIPSLSKEDSTSVPSNNVETETDQVSPIAASTNTNIESEQDSTITQKEDPLHTLDTATTPYIRWAGCIDTALPLESRAQRSGFAAIQGPIFPWGGADLRGYYNALEITCREHRSYPRAYTVNLNVSTFVLKDTYQGVIMFNYDTNHSKNSPSTATTAAAAAIATTATTATVETSTVHDNIDVDNYDDDAPFETFVLPFSDLRQSSQGREREISQVLDDRGITIESIGFAILDGVDGNFQLDVARVRAINVDDDGSIVYKPVTTMDDVSNDKVA